MLNFQTRKKRRKQKSLNNEFSDWFQGVKVEDVKVEDLKVEDVKVENIWKIKHNFAWQT